MLSPKLLDVLRAWWPVHKPKQWLFPGDRVDSCISSDAVEIACQKAHQRCGIAKPITPHSLRHYLPFRIMSRTGTRALYLRQNSRSSGDIVLTHFHQLYAGGQASTAKCIIGNRVVCRERRKVSCSIFRWFARSLSEQRYKLGPIQQPSHLPS